jgi:hypothetical protein
MQLRKPVALLIDRRVSQNSDVLEVRVRGVFDQAAVGVRLGQNQTFAPTQPTNRDPEGRVSP